MSKPSEQLWRMAYKVRRKAYHEREKFLDRGLEALHSNNSMPPALAKLLREVLDNLGDPANEARLDEIYEAYVPFKDTKQDEIEAKLKEIGDGEDADALVEMHLRWEDLTELLFVMKLDHSKITQLDLEVKALDEAGDALADSGF